jgi:hypothetical protein
MINYKGENIQLTEEDQILYNELGKVLLIHFREKIKRE